MLVVVHPSDGPRPRDQDVRLSVPPDLPDDSLPLLQTARLLQLLGGRKHVDAPQSPVRAAVTQGPQGHFRDLRRLLIFLINAPLLILLVLIFLRAGVLQLPPLWGGGSPAVAAGSAGDGGYQEAQRHEEAQTHAHHEVQGEALRIGFDVSVGGHAVAEQLHVFLNGLHPASQRLQIFIRTSCYTLNSNTLVLDGSCLLDLNTRFQWKKKELRSNVDLVCQPTRKYNPIIWMEQ